MEKGDGEDGEDGGGKVGRDGKPIFWEGGGDNGGLFREVPYAG